MNYLKALALEHVVNLTHDVSTYTVRFLGENVSLGTYSDPSNCVGYISGRCFEFIYLLIIKQKTLYDLLFLLHDLEKKGYLLPGISKVKYCTSDIYSINNN